MQKFCPLLPKPEYSYFNNFQVFFKPIFDDNLSQRICISWLDTNMLFALILANLTSEK